MIIVNSNIGKIKLGLLSRIIKICSTGTVKMKYLRELLALRYKGYIKILYNINVNDTIVYRNDVLT